MCEFKQKLIFHSLQARLKLCLGPFVSPGHLEPVLELVALVLAQLLEPQLEVALLPVLRQLLQQVSGVEFSGVKPNLHKPD